MATCFMYRHQHAGIVPSHVITSRPRPEQLAPLIAECELLHGQKGRGIIHEAELLSSDETPKFPERPAPSLAAFTTIVSVIGTVGDTAPVIPNPSALTESIPRSGLTRGLSALRDAFRW